MHLDRRPDDLVRERVVIPLPSLRDMSPVHPVHYRQLLFGTDDRSVSASIRMRPLNPILSHRSHRSHSYVLAEELEWLSKSISTVWRGPFPATTLSPLERPAARAA